MKRSIAALMIACLAVAACSGGGSKTAVSPDSTTTGTGATTTPGASANGTLPADACALVTDAHAQALLDADPGQGTNSEQIPGRLITCTWTSAVGGTNRVATVQIKQNFNSSSDYDSQSAGGSTVSGIGDKAALTQNGTSLWALKGDILVHVTSNGVPGDVTGALKAVAVAVFDELS